MSTTSRGIRNNNPLNIRQSRDKFFGEVARGSDSQFKQFSTLEYGCRAALVIIRTYITRYGVNTPRSIIARWAPPSDGNNVVRYVDQVCRWCMLRPDAPIRFAERSKVCALLASMARFESGEPFSVKLFEDAYALL